MVPTPPPKTTQKKEEPLLIAAWKEIKGWGVKKDEDGKPVVTPFDLYDLPIGMHAENFPVSEAFAKRWLDGRAFTAYAIDPKTGEMVEGRYDKDMIDTTTVKLSWLLSYEPVKLKYDDMLGRVGSNKSLSELSGKFRDFLNQHKSYSGPLDTLKHTHGDLQDMHSQFQFQLGTVSTFDTVIEVRPGGGHHYGMTDLTASLAAFAFYATVARANIKRKIYNKYNTPSGTQHCAHSQVEVTHIYVYARDSYSYNDKGPSSQYLGHWNKTGVIILPSAAAASFALSNQKHIGFEAGNDSIPPFPVDIAGKLLGKDVYQPIRNRDFLNWRDKKGRGGDFLIYSDLKLIKLDPPLSLDMGEVCR